MRTTLPGPVRGATVPPFSDPSLSSCVEQRRLLIDGIGYAPSAPELDALRIAEWAIGTTRSVLICPPDPLSPVAPAIAASVHVASIAEGRILHRIDGGSARHIAVVTRQHRTRRAYRNLALRHVDGGSALLRSVVPIGTVGADGTTHVLEREHGTWGTLFAAPQYVRAARDADLSVVELPAPDLDFETLARRPLIVVASDPADPQVRALSATMPSFGWSDDQLRTYDDALLSPRLRTRLRGRGCRVVPVVDDEVMADAQMFWQDVGPLRRLGARSLLVRRLVTEAHALFSDLVAMAVPLAFFEERTATRTDLRVRDLGQAARAADGEVGELRIPMLEEELRSLAAEVGAAGLKSTALRETVCSLLDDGADVLVVVRTPRLATIYAEYLEQAGAAGVRVATFSQLSTVSAADVAVLCAPPPSWARWVYRCGVAEELLVLCYRPSMAADFAYDEARTVGWALDTGSAVLAAMADPGYRRSAFAALETGSPPEVLAPQISRIPAAPDQVEPTAPPEAPPGLWERGDWIAPLEPPEGAVAPALVGNLGTFVEAVEIRFEDGRWAVLECDGVVARWKPRSNRVDPTHHVDAVAPGDILVFVDGESQRELLRRLVAPAVHVPDFAVAWAWLEQWHAALDDGYRKFGTYHAFAAALRSLGCTLEDQTVRLWVVGVTIGPSDPQDVRRVGEAVGDGRLADNFQRVDQAIRTVRRAHARLLPRLAAMILRAGPGGHGDSGDAVVDEASGITEADLESAVEAVTVAKVRRYPVPVPKALTGSIRDAEEEQL